LPRGRSGFLAKAADKRPPLKEAADLSLTRLDQTGPFPRPFRLSKPGQERSAALESSALTKKVRRSPERRYVFKAKAAEFAVTGPPLPNRAASAGSRARRGGD